MAEGYGEFPHNQSVPLSDEQRERIVALKREHGWSMARAARHFLDLGIKAHDAANTPGRDLLFGPTKAR